MRSSAALSLSTNAFTTWAFRSVSVRRVSSSPASTPPPSRREGNDAPVGTRRAAPAAGDTRRKGSPSTASDRRIQPSVATFPPGGHRTPGGHAMGGAYNPAMRQRGSMFAVMGLVLTTAAMAAETPVRYEVYAVRFGVIPQFAVSNLVKGADKDKKLDLPVMVWVLKGNDGRVVLVDSGFHVERFRANWDIRDYVTPAEAVARLGIRPEQVTDV